MPHERLNTTIGLSNRSAIAFEFGLQISFVEPIFGKLCRFAENFERTLRSIRQHSRHLPDRSALAQCGFACATAGASLTMVCGPTSSHKLSVGSGAGKAFSDLTHASSPSRMAVASCSTQNSNAWWPRTGLSMALPKPATAATSRVTAQSFSSESRCRPIMKCFLPPRNYVAAKNPTTNKTAIGA